MVKPPQQRRGGRVGDDGSVLWPSHPPFWAGVFGLISCSEAVGCHLPSLSLSPSLSLLGRFDSNASASSSSNEGDSDRDEKKRKQLKKAKMAKDRKSRKKPMEVWPLLWKGLPWGAILCALLSATSGACGSVLLGLRFVASD